MLIAGEAGIGQSNLVAALHDERPAGLMMLGGHCDDLATPRVFGPIRDLADVAGPDLAVMRGVVDRDSVFTALLAGLSATSTVLGI